MNRNDDPTSVVALPSPAATSAPGFFTDGDPGISLPATVVQADWANGVTEEQIAIIQAAGLTPSKGDLTQVLQAIRILVSPTNEQLLVSGTSFTVPAPKLKVTIFGAGGGSGGGDYAGGGGGGETVILHLTGLTIGSTLAYAIGAGGTAGAAGVNGGAGGSTTFNSIVANGGAGGTFGTVGTTGVGGAGGTGGAGSSFRRLPGGNGGGGIIISAGTGPGGQGGANGLGQPGPLPRDGGSAGQTGALQGSGASGGANGNAGAAGAPGAVLVEW